VLNFCLQRQDTGEPEYFGVNPGFPGRAKLPFGPNPSANLGSFEGRRGVYAFEAFFTLG